MLKLKQMKQQQQQKSAQAEGAQTPEQPTEGQNTDGAATGEKRKANTNVLSLKRNTNRKGAGTRVKPVELRLQKDVSELETIPGVEVDFPDSNNLMQFYAKVTPNEGLYQGGCFKFKIDIDTEYPYKAPRAECQTLIYHPNIDWEGHVCLNILRDDWKPILTLSSVLFGLLTLFLEPNPDDPLNKEAAQLMIDRPTEFERNVKQTLRGGYVLGRNFTKLV
eukprot:TRINITY_DN506_c0_g1_i4.p1 TRINITY_DN506_c0_g1~~TRINITY_DN506_c0_g1_i4.p1  ORF type:complete len:220 (+),score=61.19 TRINITY_DN506_c0_g1_i4:62-721(+)